MASALKKSFAAEQLKLREKRKSHKHWILLAVLGVVVAAGGYVLYTRFGVKEEPAPETPAPVTEIAPVERKSIAVLPFADMSPEGDQEWFCDGIAEEIINALTKVAGLSPIARTSAFSFKGKQMDVREIGKQLTVEYVLEGSLRKEGNRLRVTAQLIKADDGSHIWSDRYDRNIESIFAIQDEISLAIVDTLKVRLLEKEKAAIVKRPTENLEAYNLYLKGLYYGNLTKAFVYYQQAVNKDPDFALAYAGISMFYSAIGTRGDSPPDAVYPVARAAAEKALEIDDTIAEAHTSLALVSLYNDWDWPATENSLKRAVELNPGYAVAHHWYSVYLRIMGRFEEALPEAKRAQELIPLNSWIYTETISLYSIMGKFDEAMEQYQKAREINPNFEPNWATGSLYWPQGKYKEALDVFLMWRGPWSRARVGITYALSGEREKAEEIIRELKERKKEEFVPSVCIAVVYCGLGENDSAFEWLEKAYEEKNANLIFIKAWPEFDNIRSDPRYTALLKIMGLPE